MKDSGASAEENALAAAHEAFFPLNERTFPPINTRKLHEEVTN